MKYRKGTYMYGDTLCILCYTNKGDLYCDITVNLSSPLQEENKAFLHVNHIPDKILRDIEQHLKYTGIFEYSGFCKYPLVEFNKEWLDELLSIE